MDFKWIVPLKGGRFHPARIVRSQSTNRDDFGRSLDQEKQISLFSFGRRKNSGSLGIIVERLNVQFCEQIKLRPESFADVFSFESISAQKSQKKLGSQWRGLQIRTSRTFYMIYVAICPLGFDDQSLLSATNHIGRSSHRRGGTLQVPSSPYEIATALSYVFMAAIEVSLLVKRIGIQSPRNFMVLV
jgi:hypothetical protein